VFRSIAARVNIFSGLALEQPGLGEAQSGKVGSRVSSETRAALFVTEAHISANRSVPLQQRRYPRDGAGELPRVIPRHAAHGHLPPRPISKIDVGQRLALSVLHDVGFRDGLPAFASVRVLRVVGGLYSFHVMSESGHWPPTSSQRASDPLRLLKLSWRQSFSWWPR
jgi:hypothetical protein